MSPRSHLYMHYAMRGLAGGTVAGFALAVVVAAMVRSRRREPGPCPLCEPGGRL